MNSTLEKQMRISAVLRQSWTPLLLLVPMSLHGSTGKDFAPKATTLGRTHLLQC